MRGRAAYPTTNVLWLSLLVVAGWMGDFSDGYHDHDANAMRDKDKDYKAELPWQEGGDGEDAAAALLLSRESAIAATTTDANGLPSLPRSKFARRKGQSGRDLMYLNHTQAYNLLWEDVATAAPPPQLSCFSQDFFSISAGGGWDVQRNQNYCSVASAAALLNSLRPFHSSAIDIPTDAVYAPYPYVTAMDIFNACTEEHVIWHHDDWDGLMHPPHGLGMRQVVGLLQCHLVLPSWKVTGHPLHQKSIEEVREELKAALQKDTARVLVNYHRATAGQEGGGHWSPLGSYSASTDRFLLLDVAKYKYPPVWIPTETLYQSMATYDDCGDWNFPQGQGPLRTEKEENGNAEALETTSSLQCKPALRGYVIVEQEQQDQDE